MNAKIELIKAKLEKERKQREIDLIEYWKNLPKIETQFDVPNLPRTNAKEWKDFYVPNLIKAGAIPKKDLIDGQIYYGDYRNANFAKWIAEKNKFEHWRFKFGNAILDTCNHFEDDDGFALFVPIRLANKEEINAYLNIK